MTSIQVTQAISRPAEATWALIGDFGALHRWHPQVCRLDLSWEGRIRTVHYANGGRAVERLEARNDAAYRYVYALVDGSLPLHACRSTLAIQPDGAGCVVSWGAEFEAIGDGEAVVEQAMRRLYAAGLGAVAGALQPR